MKNDIYLEMNGIYHKLLEGISDGISHALSRRKGREVSIEPGQGISGPKDPDTYGKHSKDWHVLDAYVRDGGYAGRLADMPGDVRKVIASACSGDCASDVLERYMDIPRADREMIGHFLMIGEMVEWIRGFLLARKRKCGDLPQRFIPLMRALQGIDSKNHPLYAAYRFEIDDDVNNFGTFVGTDRIRSGNFRNFINLYIKLPDPSDRHRMNLKANLNWIDVSGVRDMSILFNNVDCTDYDGEKVWRVTNHDYALHHFNGDVSLWDVSNVMDMTEMFYGCDFYGNISGWQINPACDTTDMFLDEMIELNNEPEGEYGRLDESAANALTRKKDMEISIESGKEIPVRKEPETYGKHTKLFYWLSDFVAGKLQEFERTRDYGILDGNDLANLCSVFRGGDGPETDRIVREHGLIAAFVPKAEDEIDLTEEICELCAAGFPDMSWMRHVSGLEMTWFDGEGTERPIWECPDKGDARFIRLRAGNLGQTDPSTGTDNSVIIPTEWQSLMPGPDGTLEWQTDETKLDDPHFIDYNEHAAKSGWVTLGITIDRDIRGFYNSRKAAGVAGDVSRLPAIGHCISIEPVTLGDCTFACFLPSMGQLRAMYDYSPAIDRALEISGSEPLRFNEGSWWSSTEFSRSQACCMFYGETKNLGKTGMRSVLPMFALNPAMPGENQ